MGHTPALDHPWRRFNPDWLKGAKRPPAKCHPDRPVYRDDLCRSCRYPNVKPVPRWSKD